MKYQPDNWIILKIKQKNNDKEGYYFKVLGGWSGGYLDSDSWRMNSGIKEIIDNGDYWDIIGSSGSTYRCHKEGENVRMNIAGILASLKKEYPDSVSEVIIEEAISGVL